MSELISIPKAELAELARNAARYETVRQWNPKHFQRVWRMSLRGILPFDEMVDCTSPPDTETYKRAIALCCACQENP